MTEDTFDAPIVIDESGRIVIRADMRITCPSCSATHEYELTVPLDSVALELCDTTLKDAGTSDV